MIRIQSGSEHKRSPRAARRAWVVRAGACAALWLALAMLPACGGDSGDAAESRPSWLLLGSSTAAGTGASPGRGWAARLAVSLEGRGLRLDNRAVPGMSTYQALPAAASRPPGRPATHPAQDLALALDSGPRVLVLAFPSNDAVLGFAAEESTANLLLMRELALRRGAGVLVLSSQPRDDADAAARGAMQAMDAALAAALGACFVDVRAALSGADGRIAVAYAAGDGIHLNDAGHAVVYEALWAVVGSGGCVRPP